jgi:single-strand DNA-binding protein
MLNKYICIGNLVKDPELIELKNDAKVCKFAVAINDPIKKGDVLFMDIECWNKVAENCGKFLKKGAKALIEGRIVSSSWKKNGENKTRLFVRADSVTFFPKALNNTKEYSNIDEPTSPEEEELMQELQDVPF